MDNPNNDPTIERTRKNHVRELGGGALALVGVVAALASSAPAEAAPSDSGLHGTATELVPHADNSETLQATSANEVDVIKQWQDGTRHLVIRHVAAEFTQGQIRSGFGTGSTKKINPSKPLVVFNPIVEKIGGKLYAGYSEFQAGNDKNQASPQRLKWVPLSGAKYTVYVDKNKPNQIMKTGIDADKDNLYAVGYPHSLLARASLLPPKIAANKIKMGGFRVKTHQRLTYPNQPEHVDPLNPDMPNDGGIVPPPSTEPVITNPPPPETGPTGPQSLESLPGAESKVSETHKQMLRGATVQFLRDGQNWTTATLVSDNNGKIYGITALHSISGDTSIYSPDGYYDPSLLPEVYRFDNEVSRTYSVGSSSNSQQAVAATRLVGGSGGDLLVVGFSDQAKAAALGKPIPLNSVKVGIPVEPGAEVFEVGFPQDGGYVKREQTARYVGVANLKGWNGENRPMNFIAQAVTDHTKAGNGFGASGQAAVSTGRDGSSYIYFSNSVRASGPSLDGYMNPFDSKDFWNWVKGQWPQYNLSNKTGADGFTVEARDKLNKLIAAAS